MADRYGIFGAQFNGDGTTSAEAASDGAAGAWKIDQAAGSILTGTAPTYGTLSAGDVVYIRSKTGNGVNADINVTLGASITLGNANGTAAAPITWVLDDGTVPGWSGQNGTLTYELAATTAFSTTFRDYNTFVARTKLNWLHIYTNVSPPVASGRIAVNTFARLVGLRIGYPNKTSTQEVGISILGTLEYCNLVTGRAGAVGSTSSFLHGGAASQGVMLNCEIELASATNGGNVFAPFTNDRPYSLVMIGGRIFGPGATSGQNMAYAVSGRGGGVSFIGVDYPKTISLTGYSYHLSSSFSAVGCDNGLGSVLVQSWGTVDSRDDNNYPVLNATLPNSTNTAWSWRLYPAWTTPGDPSKIIRFQLSKLYTSAAAAKKIRLEMQITTGFAVNKSTLWMDVSYIDDATGLRTYATTEVPFGGGGALDSSTAGWDLNTWGAINLTKYKLELTTATSIKQDTLVLVTLRGTCISASDQDVIFICPDVQADTP